MTGILQRFTNIKKEEVAPVVAASLFFFCVLTALMVLRPARESIGMQSGLDSVRWLFVGTAIVTFLDGVKCPMALGQQSPDNLSLVSIEGGRV